MAAGRHLGFLGTKTFIIRTAVPDKLNRTWVMPV